MNIDLILTTTATIQGKQITAYLGPVIATEIVYSTLGWDVKEVSKFKVKAMKTIQQIALKMEADAVVDLALDIRHSQGCISIHAMGTAVNCVDLTES